MKKIPVNTDFEEKYNRPENKFYNFIAGKGFVKPIEDKATGRTYFVPVSALQIVVLPDGSVKMREV